MGSGLIVGGSARAAGLDIVNWRDCPDMRAGGRPRSAPWVRAVVWHATKGYPHDMQSPPAPVLAGAGPRHGGGRCALEVNDFGARSAGAHAVIDHDGTVYQLADLVAETTSWCQAWSEASVNLALFQGLTGELYEDQLVAAVALTDAVTRELAIQRQIPHRYLGHVHRLVSASTDVVGVFGHRDAARNRGPGDPGSAIFYRLGAAGYDVVDFSLMGDRSLWVRRQRQLKVLDDGIAGPKTVQAVRRSGRPHGLWVLRPGD